MLVKPENLAFANGRIALMMNRLLAVLCLTAVLPANAETIRVAPGQLIQSAISTAQPGDSVVISAGTYRESLQTVRAGEPERAIMIRAEEGATVTVVAEGRVLDVRHPHHSFSGLSFDGSYGSSDAVRVRDNGDQSVFRNIEVLRSGRDCVDMGDVTGVLFDGCLIHNCLYSTAPECSTDSCRQDAHGITGGAVRNITIRDTEIHTFSGDGVQFDPGRSDLGWSDVVIENVRFWLAPLPSSEGGFAQGVVPGENAIDTKTSNNVIAPAVLTLRDVTAFGFQGGLINNMAAFNIKENVDFNVDGVTTYDSEIAFRLRGRTSSKPRGARISIQNALVYDVATAFRVENDITDPVRILHATLGRNIEFFFRRASAPDVVISVQNSLILANELPEDADTTANRLATENDFVDVTEADYRLVDTSASIDSAPTLSEVSADRAGVARPQGTAADFGAYEACQGNCTAPPPVIDEPPNELGGGGGCRNTGGQNHWFVTLLLCAIGASLRKNSSP